MTHELLNRLAEPFKPEYIEWLPGAAKGDKCMAMAYADLRAYMERLDEVCGLDWSISYTFWGERRIAAHLTIYIGDALGRREEIVRSSTGEMDAQDERNNMGGTVAEAQAFKRAAAMFGLGRYLYDLPSAWVDYDPQAKKISKAGQADLDKRYADWYKRKVATAQKPQDAPQQPAAQKPTTAPQTAHRGPAAPADVAFGNMQEPVNPFDGGAPEPEPSIALEGGPQAIKNPITPKTLQRLNIIGTEFYTGKGEWDATRPQLVQWVTQGAETSSKNLTENEGKRLISAIERKRMKAQRAKTSE